MSRSNQSQREQSSRRNNDQSLQLVPDAGESQAKSQKSPSIRWTALRRWKTRPPFSEQTFMKEFRRDWTSHAEAQSDSGDLLPVQYSTKAHAANLLNRYSDGCFRSATTPCICELLQIPCRQHSGAGIAESGAVLY